MSNEIERIIGRFYAQHAHMITNDVIERAQKNDKHNMNYNAGNILLLNGRERMVIPHNLIQGHVITGPWVNQLYQFELIKPAGEPQDRLEAVRTDGTIDTTLLKIVGPFGPDFIISLAHTDYEQGKAAFGTYFGINNIRDDHQSAIRKSLEEGQDNIYRIDNMILQESPQNIYK